MKNRIKHLEHKLQPLRPLTFAELMAACARCMAADTAGLPRPGDDVAFVTRYALAYPQLMAAATTPDKETA